MVLGLVMAVATGLLWSVFGVVISYAKRQSLDAVTILGASAVLVTVAAWLVVPDHRAFLSGGAPRVGDLAPVMLVSGLFGCMGSLAIQAAMARGHHGAVWAIGQSALVLPFLTGVLIFDQHPAAHRAAGVGAILAGLVALGLARRRASDPPAPGTGWAWLALAMLAFLGYGIQQSLATVPSYWPGWSDAAHLRVPLAYTGSAAAYGAALLWRRSLPRGRAAARAAGLAAGLAAVGLASQWIFYAALDRLAAADMTALAFPLAVGTCIVGFAAYSLAVLREPVRPSFLAGVALSLAGVVLISL